MNNQRPMFINILFSGPFIFLVVGSLFSAVVGIVGSLLWLAVKIFSSRSDYRVACSNNFGK